jgi:hypothetical protein
MNPSPTDSDTVKRCLNPSWLTMPASAGIQRPPTRTQLQVLPLNELTWENFERLCFRIAKANGDVEQWTTLFGTRGQKQHGIDIFARRPATNRYSCWQSKRHRKFTIASLKAAIAAFEQGEWASKSEEFIVCTSASLQDVGLQRTIEAETTRLQQRQLTLRVWGQHELSDMLKDKSRLVSGFFGREWARDFCEDDTDQRSVEALDADEIATLRSELRRHYVSNFSSLDPGVLPVMGGSASNRPPPPLEDRFVEPDIETLSDYAGDDPRGTAKGSDEPREHQPAAQSDLTTSRQIATPSAAFGTIALRRRISAWVAEGDQTVIAGDAGLGKSTALRVFALDLLHDGSRFPAVAQRWADRIPIVMPFAFWVRLVERDETEVSLLRAVQIWFQKFEITELLQAPIRRSLEEGRALLLIDGLDEWSNETAARSTMALLNTFVKAHSASAVLTGRPAGLARLGTLDPMWRQGRLAVLSDLQQRALAAVWLGHFHRSEDPAQNSSTKPPDAYLKNLVDSLFLDLSQAGTLRSLSGVPLLLSGLIHLYIRNVALPRSRFQAYDELVALLLEVHPNRRAQATLDRRSRFVILADSSLRRQTLANLAFHKRRLGFDAGCPTSDAKKLVIEYLQSADGAGLALRDAIAGAKEILSVDADTAGLIIEIAPQEVGFVHAVFEEMLAGLHLAEWELTKQEQFVNNNAGDPRWTTSILAMIHILPRTSDIDRLVRCMVSCQLPAAADVSRQRLVAEAIFGDFRCSSRLVGELTPVFVDLVSRETWFPQRKAILSLLLEASTTSRGRQFLERRLRDWFPDPIPYRARIYAALQNWPRELALELLWLGLFHEAVENKRAAAMTIATMFGGDLRVEQRLYALCHSVAEATTLSSALDALMSGWWNLERLRNLLDAARKSEHPHLRVIGIRGRIKSSSHTDGDLEELIRMLHSEQSPLFSGPPMLLEALMVGWPNHPKIISMCLKATETKYRQDRGIDRDVAKRYLLHFARSNLELDVKVGTLIREDEYFFMFHVGRGYEAGSFGPEVRAALDFRIAHSNQHMHDDIAHLAVMSGSEVAKRRLIQMLAGDDDTWMFWPVYGLLNGWGLKDPDVSEALALLVQRSPSRLQSLAHHLPEIIRDKAICRQMLLAIARLDRVARLDFLVAGFSKLGIRCDDAEVMEAILMKDFSGRGILDATDELISGFGGHPRVKTLALERLKDLDGPWEAAARAYADDGEIRPVVARFLSSLPSPLRNLCVSSMGRRASKEAGLVDQLLEYRCESGADTRTAAAIAYYEATSGDAKARPAAIQELKLEVTAIGPWMEVVRQSALGGLIALDAVTEFAAMTDYQAKGVGVDIFTLDNNRSIVTYVAKHWDRLRSRLGPSWPERFNRHGGNEWWCWDHLAPYISESVSLRNEFLDYCSREKSMLSSRAIEAIARELPRSHLLKEHCLRTLTGAPEDRNASPFEARRRQFVVGRVLGRQFADDDSVCKLLEGHIETRASTAITGLSIGWKDSAALADELERIKEPHSPYVWADAAYLYSTVGSREDFHGFFGRFVNFCTGYLWHFLPFCLEPIVARIKSDAELGSAIAEGVKKTDSGNEKASVPRILAQANLLDIDLRRWCEAEFARQTDHHSLTEFGLDVTSGDFRPVAHCLLDALWPNY